MVSESVDLAENDDLLDAMFAETDPKLEPGTTKRGEVVHRGNAEQPAPMAVSSIASAGYMEMWDTRTGEKSLTNRNMWPIQAQKRREDGSKVFTRHDPHITLKRGTLKCLLHQDNARRAEFDAMGLPVCNVDNIPSEYEVTQHMTHRHSGAWKAIQDKEERERRDEDRQYMRAIYESALTGSAKKGPGRPRKVTEEAEEESAVATA